MADFIGDRECVTHHYACDCREAHFKELEAEVERLRKLLREKQFLVNANKTVNARLRKALEVAECFLRVHSGTVKVLKQIEKLKAGE